MVLELLRGQTFRTAREFGLISSLESQLQAMAELAEALNYLHLNNIVHLDIKPDNLFIQFDGTLKLTDFGVAAVKGKNITKPGTTVGTVWYMAPEQILAEDIGPKTDLFAFGITLFEILTGSRPFSGNSDGEVWGKIAPQTDRLLQAS